MIIVPGMQLGRYEVRSKIGEGGMGEVYLAQDTKLDRKIALKFLPAEVAGDTDRMRRFVQEAKAASALNHPNIITIYEIEETDSAHFIATEFIEGETLRERINKGALKLDEVLDVAIQIASALSAAHAAGVVHRDIKPENIMGRLDGIVKVLDFGLAKLIAPPPTTVDTEAATKALFRTDPGIVRGTAVYMSPEQARGVAIDARTDIFSLGVVVYEMVAGCLPFAGATINEVLAAILNEKEPPPLARFAREVPREFEHIVSKALRKDREERYQTVRDMLIDLKDLRRDLQVEAQMERSVQPEKFEMPATGGQMSDARSLQPEGGRSGTDTAQSPAATTAPVSIVGSVEHIVNQVNRHKRGAVVTLGVLALAAAVTMVWYFTQTHAAPLTEKDTILLADFINTTGDGVFDLTLKQALTVQLGQTPFLNIFPDNQIQDTLRLMNRKPDERITKDVAREICERDGIKAMLLGSIAQLGNNYVITLEALNSRTGEALAREQIEAAGKEQVLGKLGEAATKLRGKLGESIQTIEKFDALVAQATTSSLEALKAYSLGLELQDRSGKPNESIPFHKRAIELDPNFASAHQLLGIAYFYTAQGDRAAESFTKAFELRERVSEREKFNISANYYQYVAQDLDKAVETLELWKQTYPRDWLPRSDLALLYNSVGQYEKAAEEAREAIRLNPHALPYFHMAVAFAGLNRFEEAKTTFEEALARGQDSIFTHTEIYRIAFVQGDRAKMQQQIDWARGKPDEEIMHYEEGIVAMFNGQVSRAEKLFRRRIELAEQRNAKDAVSQTHAEFAVWNSFFGNCKESKKSIADAFSISRGENAMNLSGIALAVCGETGQAQSIANEIANGKSRDGGNISISAEMRAGIEISRNNPGKAVEILESTRILERGFGIPERATYLRGIAYLRKNAGTEAMNEFQKILDRRGQFATSPFFPLAQLGLARAAMLQGDSAKARKAYQDFSALWKDADADIPILIEANREYERMK